MLLTLQGISSRAADNYEESQMEIKIILGFLLRGYQLVESQCRLLVLLLRA